jgi:hypothetical protein
MLGGNQPVTARELSLRFHELNHDFVINSHHGDIAASCSEFIDRKSSVLLSAVHSVVHYRGATSRQPDTGTGGLVRLLGELAGVSTFVALKTTHEGHEWSERVDELKLDFDEAMDRPVFLIDVHGMKKRSSLDVCIGEGPVTDDQTHYRALALENKLGTFRATRGKPFPGQSAHTLTYYTQKVLHKSALQLELAPALRDSNRLFRGARNLATFSALVSWISETNHS